MVKIADPNFFDNKMGIFALLISSVRSLNHVHQALQRRSAVAHPAFLQCMIVPQALHLILQH
jgi:hypothetical protein